MKRSLLFSCCMAAFALYFYHSSSDTKIQTKTHEKTPLHIFQKEKVKSEPKREIQGLRWTKKSEKKKVIAGVKKKDVKKVVQKPSNPIPVAVEIPKEQINKKSVKPPKTQWVSELSGAEASLKLVKKPSRERRCLKEQCGNNTDSINLVGVVVETERINHKSERLLAGDMHQGDANSLPALYLK